MTKENLFKDEILRNEKEAARFLNVSKQTLIRLRKAGQIGYYRVGRRVLFGKLHLDDFLLASEQKAEIGANQGEENGK